MKSMNHITFIIIALLILSNCGFFSSCTEELKIDNTESNKLVVNSLISPKSFVSVNLTTTYPTSVDNNTIRPYSWKDSLFLPFVKNAQIVLFENKEPCDTLQYSDQGDYISTIIPKVGKNYTLKINTPNFQNVATTTYIPQKVPILEAEKNKDKINITFKDSPKQKDYYYLFYYSIEFARNKPFPDIWIYGIKNTLTNEEYKDGFFNDESFNGDTCTIQIPILKSQGFNYFMLCHITKEYYFYTKTSNKQHDLEHIGDDFMSTFSNPMNVFTNIEGGLGVFAGINYELDSIFVQDTLRKPKK